MDEAERRVEIARLNDEFRNAGGGMIVLTVGIAALSIQTRNAILAAVSDYRHDDHDGEHSVGALMAEGHEVIWYILHHRHDRDADQQADPTDPDTTGRVLVVMLAGEP